MAPVLRSTASREVTKRRIRFRSVPIVRSPAYSPKRRRWTNGRSPAMSPLVDSVNLLSKKIKKEKLVKEEADKMVALNRGNLDHPSKKLKREKLDGDDRMMRLRSGDKISNPFYDFRRRIKKEKIETVSVKKEIVKEEKVETETFLKCQKNPYYLRKRAWEHDKENTERRSKRKAIPKNPYVVSPLSSGSSCDIIETPKMIIEVEDVSSDPISSSPDKVKSPKYCLRLFEDFCDGCCDGLKASEDSFDFKGFEPWDIKKEECNADCHDELEPPDVSHPTVADLPFEEAKKGLFDYQKNEISPISDNTSPVQPQVEGLDIQRDEISHDGNAECGDEQEPPEEKRDVSHLSVPDFPPEEVEKGLFVSQKNEISPVSDKDCPIQPQVVVLDIQRDDISHEGNAECCVGLESAEETRDVLHPSVPNFPPEEVKKVLSCPVQPQVEDLDIQRDEMSHEGSAECCDARESPEETRDVSHPFVPKLAHEEVKKGLFDSQKSEISPISDNNCPVQPHVEDLDIQRDEIRDEGSSERCDRLELAEETRDVTHPTVPELPPEEVKKGLFGSQNNEISLISDNTCPVQPQVEDLDIKSDKMSHERNAGCFDRLEPPEKTRDVSHPSVPDLPPEEVKKGLFDSQKNEISPISDNTCPVQPQVEDLDIHSDKMSHKCNTRPVKPQVEDLDIQRDDKRSAERCGELEPPEGTKDISHPTLPVVPSDKFKKDLLFIQENELSFNSDVSNNHSFGFEGCETCQDQVAAILSPSTGKEKGSPVQPQVDNLEIKKDEMNHECNAIEPPEETTPVLITSVPDSQPEEVKTVLFDSQGNGLFSHSFSFEMFDTCHDQVVAVPSPSDFLLCTEEFQLHCPALKENKCLTQADVEYLDLKRDEICHEFEIPTSSKQCETKMSQKFVTRSDSGVAAEEPSSLENTETKVLNIKLQTDRLMFENKRNWITEISVKESDKVGISATYLIDELEEKELEENDIMLNFNNFLVKDFSEAGAAAVAEDLKNIDDLCPGIKDFDYYKTAIVQELSEDLSSKGKEFFDDLQNSTAQVMPLQGKEKSDKIAWDNNEMSLDKKNGGNNSNLQNFNFSFVDPFLKNNTSVPIKNLFEHSTPVSSLNLPYIAEPIVQSMDEHPPIGQCPLEFQRQFQDNCFLPNFTSPIKEDDTLSTTAPDQCFCKELFSNIKVDEHTFASSARNSVPLSAVKNYTEYPVQMAEVPTLSKSVSSSQDEIMTTFSTVDPLIASNAIKSTIDSTRRVMEKLPSFRKVFHNYIKTFYEFDELSPYESPPVLPPFAIFANNMDSDEPIYETLGELFSPIPEHIESSFYWSPTVRHLDMEPFKGFFDTEKILNSEDPELEFSRQMGQCSAIDDAISKEYRERQRQGLVQPDPSWVVNLKKKLKKLNLRQLRKIQKQKTRRLNLKKQAALKKKKTDIIYAQKEKKKSVLEEIPSSSVSNDAVSVALPESATLGESVEVHKEQINKTKDKDTEFPEKAKEDSNFELFQGPETTQKGIEVQIEHNEEKSEKMVNVTSAENIENVPKSKAQKTKNNPEWFETLEDFASWPKAAEELRNARKESDHLRWEKIVTWCLQRTAVKKIPSQIPNLKKIVSFMRLMAVEPNDDMMMKKVKNLVQALDVFCADHKELLSVGSVDMDALQLEQFSDILDKKMANIRNSLTLVLPPLPVTEEALSILDIIKQLNSLRKSLRACCESLEGCAASSPQQLAFGLQDDSVNKELASSFRKEVLLLTSYNLLELALWTENTSAACTLLTALSTIPVTADMLTKNSQILELIIKLAESKDLNIASRAGAIFANWSLICKISKFSPPHVIAQLLLS